MNGNSSQLLRLSCSLLTLGCVIFAHEAYAAPVAGTTQTSTGPDVTLDLEISQPSQTIAYGDEDIDNAVNPTSNINSVPSGQIRQTGTATTGASNITVTNNGNATFQAYAEETLGTDPATVTANIAAGLQQTATAADQAQATIDNYGTLNIISGGYANGLIASAAPRITTAISQTANNSASALIFLNNFAGASLISTTHAEAIASQQSATAAAGFATIFAGARIANLTANGTAQAAIEVNNAGTIRFDSIAESSGTTAATATSSFNTHLALSSTSANGDATVSFNNDGEFLTDTLSTAATSNGLADARVISQGYIGATLTAGGTGNAVFNFANGGLFRANNSANATSQNGDAFALADDGMASLLGINQIRANLSVTGGGDARLDFDNLGQIVIDYTASALAPLGRATATASPEVLFNGLASSSAAGSAFAAFRNQGQDSDVQLIAAARAIGTTAAVNVSPSRYILLDATRQFTSDTIGRTFSSFSNDSTFLIDSRGEADANGGAATAILRGDRLINIRSTNYSGNAEALFQNTGDISVISDLQARATGTSIANAFTQITDSFLIEGHSELSGTTQVQLRNSGTIVITADTRAFADDTAHAETGLNGAQLQALSLNHPGSSATSELTNSGIYRLNGFAMAEADEASAIIRHLSTINVGVAPHDLTNPGGDAQVYVNNSGLIELTLQSLGIAQSRHALAHTIADAPVTMFAAAHHGDIIANLNNSGIINLMLGANADSPAGAEAIIELDSGVLQHAEALLPTVDSANMSIVNSGDITGSAEAVATGGTGAPTSATLTVDALIYQLGDGFDLVTAAPQLQDLQMSIDNLGYIRFDGTADAESDAFAQAQSYVTGIVQSGTVSGAAAMSVSNDAGETIDIRSMATATGNTAQADADVVAISQSASGSGQSASFSNSGLLNATSVATADAADAVANANALGYTASGSDLSADIFNDGFITVSAMSQGAGASDLNASAIAIELTADRLTGTIRNTGTIDVVAETPDGSQTSAVGILVNGNIGLNANGLLTINNSGDITARNLSTNTGRYTFGTVLNTSNAQVATQINLLGGGSLYGNIELSDNDTVTVSGGETEFEGIINALADTADSDLDGNITEIILDGSLNIASNGTLYMRNNPDNVLSFAGAAQANVRSFNVAAGGTLALELPNYSVASLETRYPQIFTDVANITGGHLAVRVSVPSGLFADNYFYDNVIDANALTGRFGSLSINSMFLRLTDIYDNQNNVDLGISRIAFNDPVFDLDGNSGSAAGAIDADYDPTATGVYQDLVTELLSFTDPDDYAAALNSLHAAQYAGYLQSLGWMGAQFGGLLGSMNDCPHLDTTGDKLKCQSRPSVRLWGKAARSWEDIDTAPATQASGLTGRQSSLTLGLDTTIKENGLLGIAVGSIENNVRFDLFNGAIRSKGWQAGIYGAYDNGRRYITGWASYSDLNGNAVRDIAVGSITGIAQGRFDAHVWNVGSEIGARIALSKKAHFVPYAKLDYSHSAISAFTETGVPGANLHLDRSHDDFVTGQIGGKFEGDLGSGFSARADLGWRHSFTSTPTRFDAAFADGPGTRFTVLGPDRGTDALAAAARLTWRDGDKFRIEIGYDGRFSGSHVVHTAQAMLRFRF